ncbi:CBS domain-containing protein [Aestuariibius sp. 2305UL40-4]|uniref:CBS domain-containing protein n=1 Tax=Aestuariibius violaceus TaxID=3234132 RepID=UPI00345E0D96
MLVHQILKSKASDAVFTLTPDSLVSDAVSMLSAKRIGTVVISGDGTHPEGILSERDIVREIGKRGIGCLSDAVTDMMTRDIKTCAPDDTTDRVLSQMTEGRFRHMPVLKEGEMVGLISIGDVVKARLKELEVEKTALESMIMGY